MTREDKEVLDECKFLIENYGCPFSNFRWLRKLEEIIKVVEAVDTVKFKESGALTDVRNT